MKKTAYLSDIDLSTLHKKRLDEKNHYKLSWYSRRFNDNSISTYKATTKAKADSVQTKAKATNSSSHTACASNDSNNNISHEAAVVNKTNSSDRITNGNRTQSPEFYDEGYFSSPSPNRRRSGTWP